MAEPTDTPADAPWRAEFPGTARAVMRACGQAALSTAQRDAGGWPYPSLVLVALDLDATPLLLISGLADHTRNLREDPRAGLLFDGTGGLEDALTGPRLSVLGRMEPVRDERLMGRFLARHPEAAGYAGFGDFGLWRMAVERAHLVAGFGRIRWIAGGDLLVPPDVCAPLAEREADVVGHMNEDHADAVRLYATTLLGQPDGAWQMSGIDPDGCDLRLEGQCARLPFAKPVGTAEQARVELVRLVKQARGAA